MRGVRRGVYLHCCIYTISTKGYRRVSGAVQPGYIHEPLLNADLDTWTLNAGTSNPVLAQEVASYLGCELSKIKIKRFADGETYVQVGLALVC